MKIAIGTLVQWYEVEMLPLYAESLCESLRFVEDSNIEVLVDITFSTCFELEKPVNDNVWFYKDKFVKKIDDLIRHFNKNKYTFNLTINFEFELEKSTIAHYRRNFNSTYCHKADVLVWGETDMLCPKTMFADINTLYTYNKSEKIHSWIATFGSCKMWDGTWSRLEHTEFREKPFIENDTKNWWSLKYNMTIAEMNEINIRNENKRSEISTFPPNVFRKFNGCGFVISSETILQGNNIPENIFFVHEDTAMMNIINQKLQIGNEIKQYVFENILLVHNRKHPLKRTGIIGEEKFDDGDVGKKRLSHAWYDSANMYCFQNANRIGDASYKSYSWADVKNLL